MFSEITIMALILSGSVMLIGGGVIMSIMWHQDRPRCVRCQQLKPKTQLVEFLGVDMCEPCENVAQYYNQRQ